MITFKIGSAREMTALGKALGKNLKGGEIIELIGPLGAGKTTLAKGILAGAGAASGFSPTFVLDAVHKTAKRKIREIHHLDLYRLKSPDELITLGLEDLTNQKNTVLVIEWAERFKLLPKNDKLKARILVKKDCREVKITADDKYKKLVQNIRSGFA